MYSLQTFPKCLDPCTHSPRRTYHLCVQTGCWLCSTSFGVPLLHERVLMYLRQMPPSLRTHWGMAMQRTRLSTVQVVTMGMLMTCQGVPLWDWQNQKRLQYYRGGGGMKSGLRNWCWLIPSSYSQDETLMLKLTAHCAWHSRRHRYGWYGHGRRTTFQTFIWLQS